MTQAEQRLIEQGWEVLVERLGVAEATRFVMLLDRRTGGAVQQLRSHWSTPLAITCQRHTPPPAAQQAGQFDGS